MDFYRELILDHYKHPRNYGSLDKFDVRVEEGNVTCGDRIVIEIKMQKSPLRPAKRDYVGQAKIKIIEDIRFSGEGCAISMASASLLTEKVKGMQVQKVLDLKTKDILDLLGTSLTPSRIRCALLPLEVLHKAVAKLRQK